MSHMCTTTVIFSNHSPEKPRSSQPWHPVNSRPCLATCASVYDSCGSLWNGQAVPETCRWQGDVWKNLKYCDRLVACGYKCIVYQIMSIEYGNYTLIRIIYWCILMLYLSILNSSILPVKGGDAAPLLHMSWSPLECFELHGGKRGFNHPPHLQW